MADINVIIVNYNSGFFLSRAVDSVLRSSFVSRVIVVDNASRDASMRELFERAAGDPRITCIQNKNNLGFARACNMGIGVATGDYLLFLNPDCEVHAGVPEELVGVLECTERAGIAGPLVLNPDGTEQAGCRRTVPTPWRSFVRAFGLSKYHDRYPKLFPDFHMHLDPLPEGVTDVEAISGSCMMVRRAAMDQVGLLDENYFLHCEDLDWCMRFRQLDLRILFVPNAVAVHQQGVCSMDRPIFVEWNKHKGMIRFYRKFFHYQYPGLLLWIVRGGVWLRFGFVVARNCIHHIARSTRDR